MSVSLHNENNYSGQKGPALRSRFEVCRRLSDGEPDLALTRVDPLFEEQASPFAPIGPNGFRSPGEWLCVALRKLITATNSTHSVTRPIHIPMPIAILMDESAARDAKNTVQEEGYCPQEFMLEFQDASLACGDASAMEQFEAFRRSGFRIAMDARKSFATPFCSRLRPAIERIRVNADELMYNDTLQMRADIVACLGGEVIVDRANWRDSETLEKLGATHALKMMADA